MTRLTLVLAGVAIAVPFGACGSSAKTTTAKTVAATPARAK